MTKSWGLVQMRDDNPDDCGGLVEGWWSDSEGQGESAGDRCLLSEIAGGDLATLTQSLSVTANHRGPPNSDSHTNYHSYSLKTWTTAEWTTVCITGWTTVIKARKQYARCTCSCDNSPPVSSPARAPFIRSSVRTFVRI